MLFELIYNELQSLLNYGGFEWLEEAVQVFAFILCVYFIILFLSIPLKLFSSITEDLSGVIVADKRKRKKTRFYD